MSRSTPRRASTRGPWVGEAHRLEPHRALQAGGTDGPVRLGGVETGVAISSLILAIDARACCYESNVWDSCWMGEKNWSR